MQVCKLVCKLVFIFLTQEFLMLKKYVSQLRYKIKYNATTVGSKERAKMFS